MNSHKFPCRLENICVFVCLYRKAIKSSSSITAGKEQEYARRLSLI